MEKLVSPAVAASRSGGQVVGAASAAKVEKRVDATSAKLFQGKFQIKADRVDDWTPAMRAAMLQHSYITNSQISDLLPLIAISYGYGKLVSAASTARRSGCGAASAAKAEKRKLFQGKFQIKADRVDDWTPAMRAAMLQHSDFLRLWEARERGVDCKAGKFQIKADRVDDWTPAMRAAMLQHSYITNSQISDLLPLIAISYGYGKLVSAASTARRSGCGAASAAKAEKRVARRQLSLVISDLLPLIAISYGYGKLVSAASTARRSGCGAASAAKAEKRVARRQLSLVGKFQIKADRVDDWTPAMRAAMLQHSYITNSQISDLLPLIAISYGYGKLVSAASTARRSGCGAASAAKAEKRIKADRVDALDSGYDFTTIDIISYGYGQARERGVDCKTDRAWAQGRLQGGQSESAASAAKAEKRKLFQGKFQIKADRVDDWTPAMPISYGYGQARERGVDCKAVRLWARRRWQGVQSVSAASAAKAEKRVGATSAVAGSKNRANGLRLLHWPCVETIPGKFQIKADRVDDWTPAMTISYGYGKLVSAASTARRSGCGAASAAKAEKRGKFQIKADRVDDWTPAMRAAMLQHSDFLRLWEARERGVDCKAGKFQIKADRVDDWTPAMRAAMLQHSYITNSQISDLLPLIAISYGYGKLVSAASTARRSGCGAASAAKAEKRKLFQGKFQIKADRVDDWTPAMRAAMLQHSYITNSQISDLLPLIAISYGYGKLVSAASTARRSGCGAASAAKAEKRKLFQGKFQIKADRVDDWTPAMRAAMLQHSYITNSQISDLLPLIAISYGYGKLVSAASTARRSGCGAASAAKAEKRGKFQIKADRVDDWTPAMRAAMLQHSYITNSQISDLLPLIAISYGYGKLVSAASTARRSGCGAASAAKAEKRVGATDFRRLWEARERGVDCKAVSVGAASAAKAEKRKLFQGKFQIKADRVDDWTPAMPISYGYGKLVSAASTARRSGCGAASAAKAEKRGKFQIKADRVDDWTPAMRAATLRHSDFLRLWEARERGVDCKAGKFQIKADRVDELDSGYECSKVTALKLFQGKFQIKADRVDDWTPAMRAAMLQHSYITNSQISDLLPLIAISYGYGKLVSAASTARRSGCGAASAAKAEKRKLFQGKFQIKADRVDDWTPAMPISYGYGKLVSAASTARRSGCGAASAAKAEKRKLFQGKFQIKADRVDDWTPAMRAAMLQHSYITNSQISDLLPLIAISYGYGKLVSAASTARRSGCGAASAAKAEKRKLFQGKFQIKADRVDDWTPAMPISYGYGKLVSAASTARRSGCGAASAAKAEKRKLFQGKFQIKADRVDDLDPGYACSNVTALKLFQGKFQIKADRVDDWTPAMRAAMLQHSDFLRLWEARERGVDCKARFPTAMGKLVSAASAAKVEKRVDATSAGKLQIKADRVDELDSGYECSNVTALVYH
ncbi:hypothetical protein PInf_014136 [Phytophthora infestans]|nr:hypothetical protein PInf_014136 [Phytophthora infestans]